MLKIITIFAEIIYGGFSLWKKLRYQPDANEKILQEIKDAEKMRVDNSADEHLLLPPNQRDS